MEYGWCELTGEMGCVQPLDKPASRCELCLGCLDPKFHPRPGEVMTHDMSGVSEASGSTS